MKNAKRVDFRFKIKGNGIVNYDSGEQKWVFNNSKESNGKRHRMSYFDGDNVMYAKKNFYEDKNGDLQYKIKISNNCIINAIFSNDAVAQNPAIVHHENILFNFIASPVALLRGYMIPVKNDMALKRKSPISISDAEQVSKSLSQIETFSRSGQKGQNKDAKDNTFFKKETVGEIEYAGEGSINLAEMQFVSADPQYDRFSFDPDKFELYKNNLKPRMSNFNSEMGDFQLKTSTIEIPEFGFKLSSENVLFLVKEFFKRFLMFSIEKRGGRAHMFELQYKVVVDPIEEINNKEENWITLHSQKDIDNINFQTEDFYILQDPKEIKKVKEEMKKNEAETKMKNNVIAQKKADAKDKARADKNKAKSKSGKK